MREITSVKFSCVKFSLGQIVATPGALGALQRAGQSVQEFLARHAG